MIEVASSTIRAIGYHGGTMTIEFRSGRVYDYPDFSYSVFEDFINATSKGEFYNQHIRGKYNN